MKIGVDIDVATFVGRLGLTEKAVAYASVKAINNTALRIQARARETVRHIFHIRKEEFIMREVAIISPFASVKDQRPYAEIFVGEKDRLLLPIFDKGGGKRPFTPGAKSVAVPMTGSAARPNIYDTVPDQFQFTKLGLKPQRSRKEKKFVGNLLSGLKGKGRKDAIATINSALNAQNRPWQGNNRTFMIPGVGVFQRIGSGKQDTRLIYFFDKNVPIPATLQFLAMAKLEGQAWFNEELDAALVFELGRTRR